MPESGPKEKKKRKICIRVVVVERHAFDETREEEKEEECAL